MRQWFFASPIGHARIIACLADDEVKVSDAKELDSLGCHDSLDCHDLVAFMLGCFKKSRLVTVGAASLGSSIRFIVGFPVRGHHEPITCIPHGEKVNGCGCVWFNKFSQASNELIDRASLQVT